MPTREDAAAERFAVMAHLMDCHAPPPKHATTTRLHELHQALHDGPPRISDWAAYLRRLRMTHTTDHPHGDVIRTTRYRTGVPA